jgi:hypothetical protein
MSLSTTRSARPRHLQRFIEHHLWHCAIAQCRWTIFRSAVLPPVPKCSLSTASMYTRVLPETEILVSVSMVQATCERKVCCATRWPYPVPEPLTGAHRLDYRWGKVAVSYPVPHSDHIFALTNNGYAFSAPTSSALALSKKPLCGDRRCRAIFWYGHIFHALVHGDSIL